MLNFNNYRRNGEKISLQIVEVQHGIYVNFVYFTVNMFQSISLYCSKDEQRKIVNFKNGKHVIIVDSLMQSTLAEKLQIKEWIMSVVNLIARKDLNQIERDAQLTEMYYAILANLHQFAHLS